MTLSQIAFVFISGEFLSDKILSKITKGLGDDWFEVLVGLGMPVMELKGLDMTNRFNSDLLVSGLSKLVHDTCTHLFITFPVHFSVDFDIFTREVLHRV